MTPPATAAPVPSALSTMPVTISGTLRRFVGPSGSAAEACAAERVIRATKARQDFVFKGVLSALVDARRRCFVRPSQVARPVPLEPDSDVASSEGPAESTNGARIALSFD